MYTEVILRPKALAGQKIYGEQGRKLLVEALDGTQLTPLLFGRGDDGKTLGTRVNGYSPLAPIVFDGGNGFLRIYGVGEAGTAVLKKELGNILGALSTKTGGPVTMDMKQGKVEYKPEHRVYGVRRLGLAKHGKIRGEKFYALYERYQSAADEEKPLIFREAEPMIRAVLDRDIAGMAEQLGIMNIPRDLDITIHDGSLGVSRIHNDRAGHIGLVTGLRFSMIGDLVGPWSAGHLRAYGYGLIKREVRNA